MIATVAALIDQHPFLALCALWACGELLLRRARAAARTAGKEGA